MQHHSSQRKWWWRSVLAIFRKDWESELRTRYAINTLAMFVVTTIAIIVFSLGSETPSLGVRTGMLWVVVFFTSMSGLSRSFVSEEERGTSMTLQLLALPSAVLAGKLLFNLVMVVALNIMAVLLYSVLLSGFMIQTYSIFCTTLLLGSMGLASAATVIAAIIAKANMKGALFPVLSLPILLPLLLTLINATRLSAEGAYFEEAYGAFQVLVAYIGAINTISYLLFDYIWKD